MNPGFKGYFLLIFVFAIFLLSCTPRPSIYAPEKTFEIYYVQFGSRIFIEEIRGEPFRFEGAKEIERVSGGWLVKPEGKCVKVLWGGKSRRLCVRSVPPVYPHLKILRMDSYALDLKVLSLFPKLGLFIWEKGGKPDFLNPRPISPGIHSLRGLSLGKTYLISAAVILGPDIYGPFSPPLEVEVNDEEPPLPPSGGGYFLKGDTLVLVWDPSPSRDVVGYIVEREGEFFKVKKNVFRDRDGFKKRIVLYNIKALDGAGHESMPLRLKVVFPEEEKDEKERK
ncbi:hypothetical protein TDIS_2018 [Thermosulfurimonas dismutans]|uniref:Fibronectin type-III domain-containing protein n=1 Tax=Thermosulfurimonas dismutans TaxID=999894 RepID=A0A179D2N0_9BACT|nr:hypothetical protein TDIS_2018 [Thermosulfurimonas dismutans]